MTILLYALVALWALYALSVAGLVIAAAVILRNLIKGIV